MICRRFSKSSSYTSLFLLNLFKDGNVSGFLLLSANMTKTKAEQHNDC
ncbi:hypothetical protein T4A_3861 [Trichinella pseudospiralis]|uniref:Uncharacterized protein n=1 Tax=Trichinella pseudospiralis TaxID=6337 RepID=A0A0V1GKN0_TRIPS|nr:hypothetical protein T4A_3861 [Trichinella pseudospiralis]KRY94276.1 hypothetical protein T4C_3171 [Trichinella pseudospiralis]KRY98794.1 hypothetical protein T4C_87 [Trichinella pseudospiralis]